MLDDPKIKSAIFSDRGTTRISHLGLQAEDDELAIIKGRIVAAGVTYNAALKNIDVLRASAVAGQLFRK